MRIARRYLITGRVQGVGYRFFVSDVAKREGLHGWVRNRPNGAVEALAEGEAEALERFERLLSQGPRLARVDGMDITDIGATGHDRGFIIR
jgi:acylphosphatase